MQATLSNIYVHMPKEKQYLYIILNMDVLFILGISYSGGFGR
jgi:hypothetical protein